MRDKLKTISSQLVKCIRYSLYEILFPEPEDDSDACLRALKFDNLTSEEFDCTWKACSQYRLKDLKTFNTTDDIMEKWPFYKNPSGFRLVSSYYY